MNESRLRGGMAGKPAAPLARYGKKWKSTGHNFWHLV
jgi:hypothetical protein